MGKRFTRIRDLWVASQLPNGVSLDIRHVEAIHPLDEEQGDPETTRIFNPHRKSTRDLRDETPVFDRGKAGSYNL